MKSYRYLVAAVLCATVLGGWVSLGRATAGLTDEYERHLADARAAAEIGVTNEVRDQYAEALAIHPSLEIHLELADYLRDFASEDLYADELERVVAQYPERPEGYERLAPLLVTGAEYAAALDLVDRARAAEVGSESLDAVYDSVVYRYTVGGLPYEDVHPFSADDVGAVRVGDVWRLTRADGNSVEGTFDEVGTFWGGNAAVVLDGLAQYVDGRGRTSHVATRLDYASYGILAEGIIPALGKDGRHTYLTDAFQPAFDGATHAEATSFAGGVAAVSDGTSWTVLAPDGSVVGEGYGDVARDEGIVAGQERYFAKVDGRFQMFDLEGARVGELAFDDARPFGPQGDAAVRIGEAWGFVGAEGDLGVEPQFADARSFANGLAAVRVGDRWGYADDSGRTVIAPTFLETTDFSSTGGALVAVPQDTPAPALQPESGADEPGTADGTGPAAEAAQPGDEDDEPTGAADTGGTTKEWRLLQLVRYER